MALRQLIVVAYFASLTIISDRSLAACELLCNAGYKHLFWVQGGLETAEEEVCISNVKLQISFLIEVS